MDRSANKWTAHVSRPIARGALLLTKRDESSDGFSLARRRRSLPAWFFFGRAKTAADSSSSSSSSSLSLSRRTSSGSREKAQLTRRCRPNQTWKRRSTCNSNSSNSSNSNNRSSSSSSSSSRDRGGRCWRWPNRCCTSRRPSSSASRAPPLRSRARWRCAPATPPARPTCHRPPSPLCPSDPSIPVRRISNLKLDQNTVHVRSTRQESLQRPSETLPKKISPTEMLRLSTMAGSLVHFNRMSNRFPSF